MYFQTDKNAVEEAVFIAHPLGIEIGEDGA
jgi:hypothetical protein